MYRQTSFGDGQCDASYSKANQPARFSIPLLQKKMKKGPLPSLGLWSRLVDKSVLCAYLDVKICSGSSRFSRTKLHRAPHYTVLSRSGYIIVYKGMDEGMKEEMGYAFDITSAESINVVKEGSERKVTLKWKFGKLVLYPSDDDNAKTGLSSLLGVILDAAAKPPLNGNIKEGYYGRNGKNKSSAGQVHPRLFPLSQDTSIASLPPLKMGELLSCDSSKKSEGKKEDEEGHGLVSVSITLPEVRGGGGSPSFLERVVTASVEMSDEQLSQLHAFVDEIFPMGDASCGNPVAMRFFLLLGLEQSGAIKDSSNYSGDEMGSQDDVSSIITLFL